MTLHTFHAKNKVGKPGDSRCTPKEIWLPARVGTGIKEWDLDPASNKFATVPAITKWYGVKNNGLELPWRGNVFLNCPFSSMNDWVDKALSEIEAENIKSLNFLVPGDSSTGWWKKLVKSCDAFSTMKKRHHCPLPGNPKGSPGGNLNLFYWDFRPDSAGILAWEKIQRRVGNITFRYQDV